MYELEKGCVTPYKNLFYFHDLVVISKTRNIGIKQIELDDNMKDLWRVMMLKTFHIFRRTSNIFYINEHQSFFSDNA